MKTGAQIFTKIKNTNGRDKKKNVFSYFISEIPNFPIWTFLGNAQCFVGALL